MGKFNKKLFSSSLMEYELDDKKRLALGAYVDGLGNISKACRDVGIERKTWYNWSSENEVFRTAKAICDDEIKRRREIDDESKVVEVEESLYKNAVGGKENSIMFYLKNRSPERWRNDYIQGQVYIQNTKNTLNFIQTNVGDMTNEELLAEARRLGERLGSDGRDKGRRVEGEVTEAEFKEADPSGADTADSGTS